MSKQNFIYESLTYEKLVETLDERLETLAISESEKARLREAVRDLKKKNPTLREKGTKKIIGFLLNKF